MFDELDIKVLEENFDSEIISKLEISNVAKIYKYLKENGIYYASDLLISSLDLFMLSYEDFKKKFENLKIKLGNDYVTKLECDASLIEMMYYD